MSGGVSFTQEADAFFGNKQQRLTRNFVQNIAHNPKFQWGIMGGRPKQMSTNLQKRICNVLILVNKWSERQDSNLRRLAPKASALARLSYAPNRKAAVIFTCLSSQRELTNTNPDNQPERHHSAEIHPQSKFIPRQSNVSQPALFFKTFEGSLRLGLQRMDANKLLAKSILTMLSWGAIRFILWPTFLSRTNPVAEFVLLWPRKCVTLRGGHH